jgi:hypothetical protein
MNEFYNTTKESGEQLQMFTDKAISQEEKIMVIFKQYYRLTAYECYQYYLLKHEVNTPLTSIRRAITNLTNKDKLVMTEFKKKGGYGMNNYVYKLR